MSQFAFVFIKEHNQRIVAGPITGSIKRGAFPSPSSGPALNTGTSEKGGQVEYNPHPIKRYSHSLSTRKVIGEASKRTWADPEVRKRRIEGIRRANGLQKAAADPKVRERRSQITKRLWADPEYRKSISEAQKLLWADPEVRKRRGEVQRRTWADPEVRKRRIEAARNPERRRRISEGNKRHWANTPTRRLVKSDQNKRMWADFRSKLATAWRPVDWWQRSIDDRIIGTELLAKDYMSNKELGRRLDSSRLLDCKYGDSWEIVLSGPGRAANYVTEIRKWVNRPGKRAA